MTTVMRSLRPAHDETLAFAEADATLMRILGAIEEYVHTGEFPADGTYRVVLAGPCRERFLVALALGSVLLRQREGTVPPAGASSHVPGAPIGGA